jgi:hypothetical protein
MKYRTKSRWDECHFNFPVVFQPQATTAEQRRALRQRVPVLHIIIMRSPEGAWIVFAHLCLLR